MRNRRWGKLAGLVQEGAERRSAIEYQNLPSCEEFTAGVLGKNAESSTNLFLQSTFGSPLLQSPCQTSFEIFGFPKVWVIGPVPKHTDLFDSTQSVLRDDDPEREIEFQNESCKIPGRCSWKACRNWSALGELGEVGAKGAIVAERAELLSVVARETALESEVVQVGERAAALEAYLDENIPVTIIWRQHVAAVGTTAQGETYVSF